MAHSFLNKGVIKMKFNTISNFDSLQNILVLVRVDFNVPIKYGVIQDNSRIKAHIPTIKALTEKGARVVLMSHLGRPKAQETEFSLLPVANELEKLIGQPVSFCSSLDKNVINKAELTLKAGGILMLENIRFFEGETKNDTFLASMLSEDISVYVNDAFASSHRSHTSVDAICKFVNQKAVGILMEQELKNLVKVEEFKKSNKKIAVISSGAKVSTKIGLLENLIDCADDIFIAGAMANTFFAALGYEVGTSLFEEDMIETAKDILAKAKNADCNIHLPVDAVCAYELKENAESITTTIDNVPASMMILDAGEKTVENWTEALKQHDLILMNGPLGVFEKAPFDKGTNALFANLKSLPAYKVAGGGDTIFAINKADANDSFDFISTGGGALLESLEGKELPGIKAICL